MKKKPTPLHNPGDWIHNNAQIFQLVFVDKSLYGLPFLYSAFDAQQIEMTVATNGKLLSLYQPILYDFSAMPWSDYGEYLGSRAYGPAWSFVRELTQSVRNVHGDKYTNVSLVIDEPNWKKTGTNVLIHGWNLGVFLPDNIQPNYQVQVIRTNRNQKPSILKRTVDMELTHSFDNFFDRVGVNLENLFGVSDFDEDVIHGHDPRYPVFNYAKVYQKLQDEFVKVFPAPKL